MLYSFTEDYDFLNQDDKACAHHIDPVKDWFWTLLDQVFHLCPYFENIALTLNTQSFLLVMVFSGVLTKNQNIYQGSSTLVGFEM